ncbi:MAG: LPD7 domain-containing protein [Nitrospira sp.]
MNALLERQSREKDSANGIVLPREGPRETVPPEPLMNQSAAAAESLRRRFLEADNTFYFRVGPGQAAQVAFSDHGKRLTTDLDDPTVIHGMVLRAQEKGWSSFRMKGSEGFKAEVWIQATIAGIEVEGYRPSEIDRARLDERKGETATKQQNHRFMQIGPRDRSTSHGETPRDSLTASQNVAITTLQAILRERGDSAAMIAAAVEEATARLHGERLVVGTIVEHGIAPYAHDEGTQKSYFVTLETAKGEIKVWGVDLARAIERSDSKAGDTVALIQRANESVTVQSPVRNEAGEVVGMGPQAVKRNVWEVLNLHTIGVEARDTVTAAARVATHEPVVQVFDRTAARTDQVPDATRLREQERTRVGR